MQRPNQAVEDVAHPGVVAPAVQGEGRDALVAALLAQKPSARIAPAKILDELPNLAIAVDQPRRPLRLAFHFGQ